MVIDQGLLEVTWQQVRELRNHFLNESDWRAVNDRILPAAWGSFRQELRDLPQDYDDAGEAMDNFPVMPDE